MKLKPHKYKSHQRTVYEKKQYAVFGLGVFGSTIAQTLEKYGCEVLAIDKDLACIERISKHVTKAVVADATNKEELIALDIKDIDVAIVSLRNNLEDAVLATLLLRELGVPYIIAKAKNHQHQRILEKVGADKVIRAEKDIGERVARGLLHKSIVDLTTLDDRYSVSEINAPTAWHGKTVVELNVRHVYKLNLIGVKHKGSDDLTLNIDPTYNIQEGDCFLVIGEVADIEKFDYLY
ncbi:MAG: TrkA family potassium uptake protein [Defluviitaleaceae bacterium]|nr:TrkA family potassium uptake protein [Defluviitaleaceae bacterium]